MLQGQFIMSNYNTDCKTANTRQMKTLILILLLISTNIFAQKDLPPVFSVLDPAHPKAIYDTDTSKGTIYQVTLRNDTASATDQVKFYEINRSSQDTMLLKVIDAQTWVEDTVITKTGAARNYIFVKPVGAIIMVKLMSSTSIDVYVRKREFDPSIMIVENGLSATPPAPQTPTYVASWNERPVNLQLFPRASNDSGNSVISGTITNDGYWDTCVTKLYRAGVLTKTTYQVLTYSSGTANFSITNKIKAEKQEYTLRFYLRYDGADSLLYQVDSLVAGDVYLVTGQSNAQYTDTATSINNYSEWMRTFGIQTDSLNYHAYSAADTVWHRSYSNVRITSIANYHPYNVGGIGQYLQINVLDSFNIPTCVINGAMINTSIRSHTRNNSAPTSFSTLYGKTLYRIQKAKVQDNIKAIFWFQGESDMTSTTGDNNTPTYGNPRGVAGTSTYPIYFDSLFRSWVTDYDFQKVFVYQMRQVEGGIPATYQSVMREVQRTFLTTYNDTVQLIPTFGIGSRSTDNLHYDIAGYRIASQYAFLRAKQLFYNSVDTVGVRAPSIRKAFYTSTALTTIGMLFNGSNPVGIPADTLSQDIEKNFYLDGAATTTATSLTLSNDTLYLTMPVAQSATTISYLPPQRNHTVNTSLPYNGAFIRNSRGQAVLGFNGVAIEDPPPDPPPAPRDTNNWQAESKDLFAKMHLASSTIDTTDKWNMDSLISRLKTDNVWTVWDALFIEAVKDTNAAKISWTTLDSNYLLVGQGYNNLLPNIPTFTSYRGYKNASTDSVWLSTNVRPDRLSHFNKDSGTVLGWSGDEYSAETWVSNNYRNGLGKLFSVFDSTTNQITISLSPIGNVAGTLYTLGNWNTLISQSTAIIQPVTTSTGMFSLQHKLNSSGANDSVLVWRNDTLKTKSAGTTYTFYDIPYPFYLGASNIKNTQVANFFKGRNVIFAIGSKLTATQMKLFYQHIKWYLDRVGALSTITLSQPVKDNIAIMAPDSGMMIAPYTPIQYDYDNDSLRMYTYNQDSAKFQLYKSELGITWQHFSDVTPSYFESSIRQNGSATNWYGLTHDFTYDASRQYFYLETNSTDDGITWNKNGDTLNDGSKWFGEDHTSYFMTDSNKYYLLLRKNTTEDTKLRKISLVKTTDFTTYTPRRTIVPADTSNFFKTTSKDYAKSFYYGNMFTTGVNEYWMLATIMKHDTATAHDSTHRIWDIANANATDNCLWTELLFSYDGDNWRRTNDTNAFIPLNNSYKQIYALPTVIGDTLYIYTFESKKRHWSKDPLPDIFSIWRYKISLTDLRAYKP